MTSSSCSTESRIKHYSGDGEIKARPNHGFWGGGGGYTLQFKPIKLDHPAHFNYHFAGLPGWKAELLFAIEDSGWRGGGGRAEWDQRDLKGNLAMSLKDVKGKVVFQFEKKLSELEWSYGGQSPWELYDERAVNFTPDSREYILDVTVDPDPILKDAIGYVLIEGGGHEPVSIGF